MAWWKFWKKKSGINFYLVNIESGRHNIEGLELRIVKESHIIAATDEERAIRIALSDITVRHYGHEPSYQIVIDIKQIKK